MRADLGRAASSPLMADSSVGSHLASAMLRLVTSMLIALALLFSPAGMAPEASAARQLSVTAGANFALACPDKHSPAENDKSRSHMGCAAACAMIFPAAAILSELASASVTAVMSGEELLVGVQNEGRTPPPRNTSEI